MKSLFNFDDKRNILGRIESLNRDSQPNWGKMSVAQMFAHCSIVIRVGTGQEEEKNPSFMVKLLKPIIRKFVLGDKPYPKNSATSPQFKILSEKDFQNEKEKLIHNIEYFSNPDNKKKILEHPSKVFGVLTEEEKGWAQYKHLDHHLNQFGV